MPKVLGTDIGRDGVASQLAYLVVARGHAPLVGELRDVIGGLAWVRAIEDRRQDSTILPREGRPHALEALGDVRRRLRLDFAG